MIWEKDLMLHLVHLKVLLDQVVTIAATNADLADMVEKGKF